jgi:glutathione S-transferase
VIDARGERRAQILNWLAWQGNLIASTVHHIESLVAILINQQHLQIRKEHKITAIQKEIKRDIKSLDALVEEYLADTHIVDRVEKILNRYLRKFGKHQGFYRRGKS